MHRNFNYDLTPLNLEELKVHIRHTMLWEFKNNKKLKKTTENKSSADEQNVISDLQVRKCFFFFFCSGDMSLRDEPRLGRWSDLDQEALRELVKDKRRKSPQHIPIYNVLPVEKTGKLSQLGVSFFHTRSEKNKKECISISTSHLSRWWISLQGREMGLLWQLSSQKISGLAWRNLRSLSQI